MRIRKDDGGNNIMKILVVKPHEKPYEVDIENKLESMQAIVEGYIERIPLDKNVFLVCNEMGKVQELEGNRRVGNDVIAGTFFIVGANGYDFTSLTNQQVEMYSSRFEKDEIFEKKSINEWMKEVRFEPFDLEDDEEYEPD